MKSGDEKNTLGMHGGRDVKLKEGFSEKHSDCSRQGWETVQADRAVEGTFEPGEVA